MKKALPLILGISCVTALFIGAASIVVVKMISDNSESSSSDQDSDVDKEDENIAEEKDDVAEDEDADEAIEEDGTSDEEDMEDDNTAPDPTEEDVIRLFFALIDENRPDEAVMMMSEEMVGSDPVQANSAMQAWAVTFNKWDSVEVINISAYDKENWEIDRHTYRVEININLLPDAPQSMWEEGSNIRWITITKDGDIWEIAEIATGP